MRQTRNVLLLADTHLGPGSGGRLTSKIAANLAAADAVLHAGDITDMSVLDHLAVVAPKVEIHAVRGNLDRLARLPERLTLRLAGCVVSIVHDSGSTRGRQTRLRRWFPDADLVVFGHSHLPSHDIDVRSSDHHVQHQVNPGSAILRRRASTCTVAHVLLVGGVVAHVDHVALSRRAPHT